MATETSKTTSPGNAPPTPQQIPLAQIRDLPGIVNIRTYTPKDLGALSAVSSPSASVSRSSSAAARTERISFWQVSAAARRASLPRKQRSPLLCTK